MFLACLFLSLGVALAQTKVTGIVVSQDDQQPVVGVSVLVIGTNVGTVTGTDGRFSLTVPQGKSQLRFTYVGMETLEVSARPQMRIVLRNDETSIDEIVVTAMGIKRSAKALGYSATAVNNDELTATRSSDVMSGLAGKVAGVQISSASGDPGSSNSVIIRGISSLSGSNQPLYVVDGVPLTNSSVYSNDGLNSGYDFGNGANAVNPDDVESMTILKGAAATALYGSRAANGVILITTKSGKAQAKGVGIEYNGGLQWESVLRLPQMQNDFGMGWYGDKTMIENGSWGPAFDGSVLRYGQVYNNSQQRKTYKAIPDNLKDFYDTGFRYSNSVSFNGETNAGNYFVSLSQVKDDGIIPTDADSYKKYTFSARASHKVDKLTISTSLNYAYQENKFVQTGQGKTNVINALSQTPRDISIAELKDLSNPFNTPGYYYTPYGVTNPYFMLENSQNDYNSERFYGKLQLDYDFLKYFRATYRFGLDTSTEQHNYGEPNLSSMYPNTPNWEDCLSAITGEVFQRTTRRREINQDFMVTFDKDINSDFHINALAGFNGNERKYSYLYGDVTNLTIPTYFDLSNSAETPTLEQYQQLRRLIGVYGQAELAWKNMVFLNVSARNDWSSTLPKDNRSFFYPGITASWIFSELFNADLKKIITFGKVRAAWGKTGNDANVYMTKSIYGQATASSSGWGSSAFPFVKTGTNAYTAGNTLGSNTLSPEMTTESEIGLQMAFFNNRISFDFSYYNRNTDKQIFSLDMDPASGYTAQNINLGKVRNRGIEALVTVVPVRTKDFEWSLTWNYTRNRNKVISLPEELGGEASIYGLSGGSGIYAVVGEEMGVFKAYTPVRDDEGNVVVSSTTGLPVKGDMKIVGSINNKYQMGFSNTFKYKGISLGIDVDVRHGGVMYSRTRDINLFVGNAIQTTYNNRNPWIIPGSVVQVGTDDANKPIYAENTTALDASNIFQYWDDGGLNIDADNLISKSYVKLRQVVLGWELPKKWLASTFLTGVHVSVYGNNLLLWTPSSNTFVDPEASSFGNDLEGNFGEYSTNPSSRKFGFNVNLKF
jgi:TonB-linked SusC/RagA family outer membrane protein